jgi:exodeoxyribonuclease VII small subunit
MQDLEKIVSELESGELSLEDSLASFERGVDLFRQCRDYLEAAKQKVEVLLGEDAQGRPIVEAYEEDLDEDDEEEESE